MFVNRKDELVSLRTAMSQKHPLMILYGRRRIGKTALALNFSKSLNHVYYIAREFGNLRKFKETLSAKFPEVSDLRDDWEVLFKHLDGKVDLVILDEFQNLIWEDKRILSVFQVIADQHLTKTRLLLLGSSISMITSKVLSYQSPLYGRRSLSLELGPLDFFDAIKFYPGISKEEMVNIYGVTGGVPYYLEKVQTPFTEWIDSELKNPTFIKDEIDFLLRYEFDNPSTYKSILEAISHGNTNLGRIKNYCGFQRTDISQYLKNLITVGLIRRVVPITENERTRRGRYYLLDDFITFWFRIISPRLNELENRILRFRHFRKDYNTYLGHVYEKIAFQYLIRKKPIRFTRIGKWWDHEDEIDIVAVDDIGNIAYFCEVKWSRVTRPNDLLGPLARKAGKLYPNMKKRFILIAKEFEEKTRKAKCIGLDDM